MNFPDVFTNDAKNIQFHKLSGNEHLHFALYQSLVRFKCVGWIPN